MSYFKLFWLIIFSSLFLAACDPASIIHYKVQPAMASEIAIKSIHPTKSEISESEMKNLLNILSEKYGLSEDLSEGFTDKNFPNFISYSRFWATASREQHPKALNISAWKTKNDNGWQIRIHEWLAYSQTEFGKKIEDALLAAILTKNSWEINRIK